MKLAAIDIGSNSIHMVVAKIDAQGTFEVIDNAKEMVGLGRETLATGYLSEDAQERGLEALRMFRSIADGRGAEDIIAVATAAVREARNGASFIARVAAETGIEARVISGSEEGRLIYLGAREMYDFGADKVLIIDMGGGSVEFVVADQRRDYYVRSLKLGVRRLHSRFLSSDPPTDDEQQELVAHVSAQVADVVRDVRKRGYDQIIGTSGTMAALARMTLDARGENPDRIVNRFVPMDELGLVLERLMRMDAAARARLPISDKRVEIIPHGALAIHTILDRFGARGFSYCSGALREGMIVDYLERNRPGLGLADEVPDPRRRAVMALARRLSMALGHSRHVARLAVRVFDLLEPDVLSCTLRDRELLEYAALMHNLGHAIARSAHHKHSLYIIRNAGLAGFTDRESLIMANIARYHRRSAPKSSHPDYMALSPREREKVKRLSAVLRVAHALDRGHRGNVHKVTREPDREVAKLAIAAHDDPTLELQAVRDVRSYFEETFGLELRVSQMPLVAAHRGQGARK